MKAILEFNLPDDEADFETAHNGSAYFSVIHELLNHLRSTLKYNENLSEDEKKSFTSIQSFLLDAMAERDVLGHF